MYKRSFFISILSILFFFACTKNNGGGTGNNGGGNSGNGGGGGNKDSLSVTGFTPLNPYVDDTLTLTGTGFNTDKTKDTVLFNQQPAHLISATSTRIVLTFPPENNMALTICNCATLKVSANGKVYYYLYGIVFKRTLLLGVVTDLDYHNVNVGRPADSLVFSGTGFTTRGLSINIDGTFLKGITVDSGYNTAARVRLPKLIFGENNNDTASANKNVIITNADGKTTQKILPFALSPVMQVFNMQSDQPAYSIAALNGSGGKISVHIYGANLKSDASVHLDGASTVQINNPLQVSGFPDSTTVQYGTAGLSTGNYQVSVWRGNTLFGTCFFQLNP